MSEKRENLQTKQPGIEYEPEGNGWPTPLAPQDNKLRFTSVIGKNGSIESRPVTSVKKSD